MALEQLRRIAPPPDQPVSAGRPDGWGQVEAALGTRLPDDYKQFVHVYGSGSFDGYLWLYNPFEAPASHGNLLRTRHALLEGYVELRAAFPEELPRPPFPEPGGLLPVGRTVDGDELYWITGGDPDRWPVLLTYTGVIEEPHDCPVTDFLAFALTGEAPSSILPRDLAAGPHTFTPAGIPSVSS